MTQARKTRLEEEMRAGDMGRKGAESVWQEGCGEGKGGEGWVGPEREG